MKLYESRNKHIKISVSRTTKKEALIGIVGWSVVVILAWWLK